VTCERYLERLTSYQARRPLAGPIIKKRPVEKKEVVSMLDFTVPDFNDINLDSADNALAVPKAVTMAVDYLTSKLLGRHQNGE
jgi:hypothetical protein